MLAAWNRASDASSNRMSDVSGMKSSEIHAEIVKTRNSVKDVFPSYPD
jgi:hypothetical protein